MQTSDVCKELAVQTENVIPVQPNAPTFTLALLDLPRLAELVHILETGIFKSTGSCIYWPVFSLYFCELVQNVLSNRTNAAIVLPLTIPNVSPAIFYTSIQVME